MDHSKYSVRTILVLIAVIVETCYAFGDALHKTRLDGHDIHDLDLYIERKLAYVHAKIDLRPTTDGLTTLEKCIYRLEKSKGNDIARILAKKINGRLSRIANKLARVNGKSKGGVRERRSIDAIGNLISDLFGNPGPADWKKNTANILAMQTAMKRLNDATTAELTDIDTNRHALEKQNEELKSMSTLLSSNQVEVSKLEDQMYTLSLFFEIEALADAIEANVDALVEVKLDSTRGFCSDRAINKEFLIENLQSIEANKVGLGPIFGSWEWREYYKNPMCTVALDNDAIWVTLRVPIVKKAERLYRVIPNPDMERVLEKVRSYGLDIDLLRERNSDRFHVITEASLEFCNKLGNTRTCSVRDVKFMTGADLVIPVEFALNRILLVSAAPIEIKLMSKCAAGVTEHKVETDAILELPSNCSYVSSRLEIDRRESDSSITNEIGLTPFDKLEISQVKSVHWNVTNVNVAQISHNISRANYAKIKAEVDEQLRKIDTRHESLWNNFELIRWGFGGSMAVLVAGLFAARMIVWVMGRRRVACVAQNTVQVGHQKTEYEAPNDKQQQQQHQQHQQHTTNNHDALTAQFTKSKSNGSHEGNEYAEVDETSTGPSVSFSLPAERSQFYKK
jgi:hypothetical protein